SVRLGLFGTLGGTFVYAFKIAGTIFTVLGELITGALGLKAMGGTVTTIVMTSQAIRVGGLRFLLEIAAYIGVNLAVFNLLPLPALDGSRVVFTLIEMIFRKPVPKNIEAVIHAVGLVLLLGFAVTVDLLHLF
ncbi:MAG: site-2 protease family protein, partial [Clostridia bacterium]|nr:site-2 protease family protein [Clostridia bacterium]